MWSHLLLLADTLRGYFWYRMYTVDWLAAAHAGLTAAETDGDADGALRAQAAAQINLASIHLRQSRYQQAIEHFTRALALTRQTGWLEGQTAALGNLGTVYWQLGRLEQAADQLVG